MDHWRNIAGRRGSSLKLGHKATATAFLELNCRFRSTQALTEEPGSIETANTSLTGGEHRTRIFDSTRACVRLSGRRDPLDPISARNRRDVRPRRPRLRGGGRESSSQICGYPGFGLFCRWRDLKADHVTFLYPGACAQLPVDFEPVAFVTIWLKHGLKREAIDRASGRRHSARRKSSTRILWQDEKSPGAAIRSGRRPQEFRFATDRSFGHFLISITSRDEATVIPERSDALAARTSRCWTFHSPNR
jgi:hypothetical protein